MLIFISVYHKCICREITPHTHPSMRKYAFLSFIFYLKEGKTLASVSDKYLPYF